MMAFVNLCLKTYPAGAKSIPPTPFVAVNNVNGVINASAVDISCTLFPLRNTKFAISILSQGLSGTSYEGAADWAGKGRGRHSRQTRQGSGRDPLEVLQNLARRNPGMAYRYLGLLLHIPRERPRNICSGRSCFLGPLWTFRSIAKFSGPWWSVNLTWRFTRF